MSPCEINEIMLHPIASFNAHLTIHCKPEESED